LTPATRTTSAIGLRDCSGSSAIRAWSITVPRLALLVSRSGDSPDTVTLSLMPPTASATLIVAVSPTERRMSVRVCFWKLGISTVRV
jgi:hypothetical protein